MTLRSFYLLSIALLTALSAHADPYDVLRLKWKDTIAGTGYDTADTDVASKLTSIANTANGYWSTMDKTVSRTFLWSDAASTTVSADITTNYSRLRAMALAYATTGCSLQGNASLLTDILGGLDWMYTNRYNPTKTIYDNWYEFEIGSPLQLTDIAVLLYDQLSPTQLTNNMNTVEKFTPSATTQAVGGTTGTFTGANRMWKIRVVAVRGAVVKDSVKLAAARDAFSDLFIYVTTGDGFYTDGSFIQHTVHPYTGGYGAALIATIVPVMSWLSGSTWAVTDSAQSNMYQWVYNSYEPLIYRGAVWDFVCGRQISRSGTSPQSTAQGIMDSILQMAQFAPSADAARMNSMVKYWALNNTVRNFATSEPLPSLPLAKQLMANAAVTPRSELIGHYVFPQMDRVVHLGKGYGFGLSMSSSRIANFESINGENLQGWFTGDGMTVVYNTDLTQYTDAYWPTIDPYRLPGVTADTTAVKTPSVPHSIGPQAQGQSTTTAYNWVGGAKLRNYGATGMQLDGWNVTLTARKSWFMFDDEIVCLGSGITSTDSRPIETTVENRKLLNTGGANDFTVNGTLKPATLGWTETMTNVQWAHLAGNLTGADIGYYFPQPATLTAVREARTGAWSDINMGGSTTAITRNYLRFGFNHGSNPTNATYQYVLLPGRNARRVSQYAASPKTTILANDGNVQAVTETALGVTAANFWTDTTQTAGTITVNKKSSVLVQNDGTFVDVSVCDPTQANTGTITVQIAANANATVSADSGITVTQTSPNISMTINVNGSMGKTFTARFYIGTPQIMNVTPDADSYVYDGGATTNFGTAAILTVKKSGAGFNRESFLRFTVPAWSGLLVGASLKLMPTLVQVAGVHGVAVVSDNTWIESGTGSLIWNNKPADSGTLLSTWTPVLNTQVSANVLSGITASGPLSLHLYGTTQTSDGFVNYASRESTTVANRPQLTLTIGHSPPSISLSAPADGSYFNHQGSIQINADALGTDGAVTNVAFYDGATLLGNATTAPYTLSPTLAGGAHLISAIATDSNGLTKTSLTSRIDLAYAPVANAGSASTPKDTATDVDLRSLVTDADTATTALKFTLGTAANGSVTLLADGHTAHFVPNAGYYGPASFAFTTTDTSNDDRILFNYDFQASDASDVSGQGRDGALNVQGTGIATFTTAVPTVLAPQHTQSLSLTENGTAGAARVDATLAATDIDLKTADWTAAGWFKRNTATNQDSVFQIGESGGFASNALTLAFYSSSTTLELANYNGTTKDVSITKTNVTTGAWHHFAIVRSGTTISLYLDAVFIGSDTAFGITIDQTKPVKWGGVTSSVLDRWFNGSLADVAMFGGALSAAEITKLSTAPVAYFGGQSATNSVAVTVQSPLESWRLAKFGTLLNTGDSADNADPDHDGIPNLLEWILNSNPAVNSRSSLPQPATVSTNATFTFSRTDESEATTTLTAQWSGDLLNWHNVPIGAVSSGPDANGATVSVTENGTAPDTIVVSVPKSNNPLGPIFIRLQATSP